MTNKNDDTAEIKAGDSITFAVSSTTHSGFVFPLFGGYISNPFMVKSDTFVGWVNKKDVKSVKGETA